jgi:hypothetical protein
MSQALALHFPICFNLLLNLSFVQNFLSSYSRVINKVYVLNKENLAWEALAVHSELRARTTNRTVGLFVQRAHFADTNALGDRINLGLGPSVIASLRWIWRSSFSYCQRS